MKNIDWAFILYCLIIIIAIILIVCGIVIDYQYKFAVITQFGGK